MASGVDPTVRTGHWGLGREAPGEPIDTTDWIVIAVTAWLVVSVALGLVLGALIRRRDRQMPAAEHVRGHVPARLDIPAELDGAADRDAARHPPR